jgi:hypothetical protein
MTTAAELEPSIEEIAYHEAGHFVARHLLLPHDGFQLITVRAHRHPTGSTFAKTLGVCEEYRDPTQGPEGVQYCETCAIGLYAGYAAQARFRPSSEERARLGARWDFEMAQELVRRLHTEPVGADVLDRACRNLLNAAQQLVTDAWLSVDALARSLASDLTLDGMRARQLVAVSEDDPNSRAV